MKTKRRHALQQNTLAKVITNAPTYWQESGGKILLVAIAVMAVVLLLRYRSASSRSALVQAADSLAMARNYIDDLQMSGLSGAPPRELASHRRQVYGEAANLIEDASHLTDDRKLSAEALVAKGDLNWTMANLPPVPGAATQPSLQLSRDPNELINSAADSYKQILAGGQPDKDAAVAARFGLAAIAENRSDWAAAKTQYDQITAQSGVSTAYVEQAKRRLTKLASLQETVLIGKPTSKPLASTAELPPLVAAPAAATRPNEMSAAARPSIAPVPKRAAPATQSAR